MTKKLVVLDSSTLILLVKIELIDILVKKFSVFIPTIVFEESVTSGKEKVLWDALKIESLINEKMLKIQEPSQISLKMISTSFNLQRGELHAIALALDLKLEFLMTDDRKAINACKVMGLKFVNAMSFLLEMYEKKYLTKEIAIGSFAKLEEFSWYGQPIINEFKKKFEEVRK